MDYDLLTNLKSCVEILTVTGDVQDCRYYIDVSCMQNEINTDTALKLHSIISKIEKYLGEYDNEA